MPRREVSGLAPPELGLAGALRLRLPGGLCASGLVARLGASFRLLGGTLPRGGRLLPDRRALGPRGRLGLPGPLPLGRRLRQGGGRERSDPQEQYRQRNRTYSGHETSDFA
jgi:hypothetical protein